MRRTTRNVPEVIQTSEMDCGPASLTAVARGFRLPCHYGRLRDACQTDVDGTSIDVLEEVACSMGLGAEQIMLPSDQLFQRAVTTLPALVVVQLSNGGTHFVVVWRRVGSYVQIMDPGRGRYWTHVDKLRLQLYIHEQEVEEDDWLEWARDDENHRGLVERLVALGASRREAESLWQEGISGRWQVLASLDAATRLANGLVRAGALARGPRCITFLVNTFHRAVKADDPSSEIPVAHFAVRQAGEGTLILRGAVLLRFQPSENGEIEARDPEEETIRKDVMAAISKPTEPMGQRILRLFLAESRTRPLALAVISLAVAVGLVLEALLFRALIELAGRLGTIDQRLGALATLAVFAAVLWLLDGSLRASLLGIGRRTEMRLRMSFSAVLPRLADEFFRSRPASDLGARAYELQRSSVLADAVGGIWLSASELLLVATGIHWVAPNVGLLPFAAAAIGIVMPLLFYPHLRDIDFKAKSMSGALSRFYFDALRGAAAIRAHGGERAVRREHEAHLTEWVHTIRQFRDRAVLCQIVLLVIELSLAAWMIYETTISGARGDALLVAFWALYIPLNVIVFVESLLAIPDLRNSIARCLEPLDDDMTLDLGAEGDASADTPTREELHAASIELRDVSLILSGATVLQELSVVIRPGEKVAVVGPSGAGKSSLLSLFLGFLRPTHGAVLIDDCPLEGAALERVRQSIAWIDPAVNLFRGSVHDNVGYGSDSNQRARIPMAIGVADLQRTLMQLPDGLSTDIGEDGGLLSGGQGQRIRIARAAMREHAPLVLMDEAFRGLERPTRARLTDETLRYFANATVLCVSHDIELTEKFDRVLVIDEGRLAQDGSPAALAAEDGLYARLLEEERRLRENLWEHPDWRHLEIAAHQVRRRRPNNTARGKQ